MKNKDLQTCDDNRPLIAKPAPAKNEQPVSPVKREAKSWCGDTNGEEIISHPLRKLWNN